MLSTLSVVDEGLASQVAYNLGLHVLPPKKFINQSIPADGNPEDFQPIDKEGSVDKSPALSMAYTNKNSIKTRKIAFLIDDGVNDNSVVTMQDALMDEGAVVEIVAPRLGTVTAENGTIVPVDKSFLTAASVLYDAVYVPGGINSVAALAAHPDAIHFLNEAYRHCKPIAADEDAMQVIEATYFFKKIPADIDDETVMREGVAVNANIEDLVRQFIAIISLHRFWDQETSRKVPG